MGKPPEYVHCSWRVAADLFRSTGKIMTSMHLEPPKQFWPLWRFMIMLTGDTSWSASRHVFLVAGDTELDHALGAYSLVASALRERRLRSAVLAWPHAQLDLAHSLHAALCTGPCPSPRIRPTTNRLLPDRSSSQIVGTMEHELPVATNTRNHRVSILVHHPFTFQQPAAVTVTYFREDDAVWCYHSTLLKAKL